MEAKKLKHCPKCSMEIPKNAIVCMVCRRDIGANWQNFKLPECLFFITMIGLIFNTFSWFFFKPQFKDYQSDFIVRQVNSVELPEKKGHRLIFEIENNTNIKWGNLSYQLIGTKDEVDISAETGYGYQWVVQPNSSSYLSVDSAELAKGVSWELKLKELEEPLI